VVVILPVRGPYAPGRLDRAVVVPGSMKIMPAATSTLNPGVGKVAAIKDGGVARIDDCVTPRPDRQQTTLAGVSKITHRKRASREVFTREFQLFRPATPSNPCVCKADTLLAMGLHCASLQERRDLRLRLHACSATGNHQKSSRGPTVGSWSSEWLDMQLQKLHSDASRSENARAPLGCG
jgi:hypothetical protein